MPGQPQAQSVHQIGGSENRHVQDDFQHQHAAMILQQLLPSTHVKARHFRLIPSGPTRGAVAEAPPHVLNQAAVKVVANQSGKTASVYPEKSNVTYGIQGMEQSTTSEPRQLVKSQVGSCA